MKYKILIIIFLFMCLLYPLRHCIGPNSTNTPDEMFSYILMSGDPIPSGIKNIQGVADTWQGYNVWMKFEADTFFIKSLVDDRGYSTTKCSSVKEIFELPMGYDHFDGTWLPNKIFNKTCYTNKNAKNPWGTGHHTLIIDNNKKTVYFYGIAP